MKIMSSEVRDRRSLGRWRRQPLTPHFVASGHECHRHKRLLLHLTPTDPVVTASFIGHTAIVIVFVFADAAGYRRPTLRL